MRQAIIAIGAAMATIAAYLLGAGTAPSASATPAYITIRVHPGTESGSPDLNCGWHDVCTGGYPDANPAALDWQNAADWKVFFRSYAFYDGLQSNAGTGAAAQVNTSCYRIRVLVKRVDGTTLGYQYYTHSNDVVTGTFVIYAGNFLTPAYTNRQVGESASSEICPDFTGPHIHQYAGTPFARNVSPFPGEPGTVSDVDVTSITNYQNYVSYQYQ